MSKLTIIIEDIPEDQRKGEKIYAISLVWDEETRVGAEEARCQCEAEEHPEEDCPRDAFWTSTPARLAGCSLESGVRQIAQLLTLAAGVGPIELSTPEQRERAAELIAQAAEVSRRIRLSSAAPQN